MPNAATYSRTTGGVYTVASTAHGLVVGQVLYVDFLTDTSGTLPADSASITVTTIVDANSFRFSYTAAPSGTPTGTLNWLATGGATYAQTGSLLTITATSHGFQAGQNCLLEFVGGSYTRDNTYTVVQVYDANTFTVTAATFATTSGGVRVRFSTAVVGTLVEQWLVEPTPSVRFFHVQAALTETWAVEPTGSVRNIAVGAEWAEQWQVAADAVVVEHFVQAEWTETWGVTVAGVNHRPLFLDLVETWDVVAEGHMTGATYGAECVITWNELLQFTPVVVRSRSTVKDLLDDLAAVWGLASAGVGNVDQQTRLVAYANAAIQEMYSRAERLDYFSRDTRTLTVGTSGSVVLADDIQQVQGFVRLATDGRPLTAVSNLAEIERYATLYLTSADDLTVPHAYYVQRQTSTGAYGVTSTLRVSPAPAADTSLKVEVVVNAPRWTWADYIAQTPIACPHRYAQLILFPLCKMAAMSAREAVVSQASAPAIMAAYEKARWALGYVDTTPKGTKAASARADTELQPAKA